MVLCVLLLAVACADDGGDGESAEPQSFCDQVEAADLDLVADPDDEVLDALTELEQTVPDELAEDLARMMDWLELTTGDGPLTREDLPTDADIDAHGEALDHFIDYVDEECGVRV